MATDLTRSGTYTFDDFMELLAESEKADLIDGVIYMASPENTDDNRLGLWLGHLMDIYVQELKLGEVFISRVAFRITEKRGPEPDLAFVAKRRLKIVRRGFVAGPPDVAIEIVSPDSVERDYVRKRQVYEQAGVREYWIIDPDERRATFLRLHRGRFREIKIDGHIFRSTVLRGFWLDVRWLWTKRRPSAYRVLQQLLQEK